MKDLSDVCAIGPCSELQLDCTYRYSNSLRITTRSKQQRITRHRALRYSVCSSRLSAWDCGLTECKWHCTMRRAEYFRRHQFRASQATTIVSQLEKQNELRHFRNFAYASRFEVVGTCAAYNRPMNVRGTDRSAKVGIVITPLVFSTELQPDRIAIDDVNRCTWWHIVNVGHGAATWWVWLPYQGRVDAADGSNHHVLAHQTINGAIDYLVDPTIEQFAIGHVMGIRND